MTATGLTEAIAQAERAVARHESQSVSDPFHFQLIDHRYVALRDLLRAIAAEVRPYGTVTDTEALAKAWDQGVRTAGAYGHEDTWTHDMTPYSQNPYRGEARS